MNNEKWRMKTVDQNIRRHKQGIKQRNLFIPSHSSTGMQKTLNKVRHSGNSEIMKQFGWNKTWNRKYKLYINSEIMHFVYVSIKHFSKAYPLSFLLN